MSGSANAGSWDPLQYWKLSDEISVVDAAFLSIHMDPGDFRLTDSSDPANCEIERVGGMEDWELRALNNGDVDRIIVRANNFRAVFKGIRQAILTNKLKARIVNSGRRPGTERIEGMFVDAPPSMGEEAFHFGFSISQGVIDFYSNSKFFLDGYQQKNGDVLYVLSEPDWTQTSVQVDDLISWFESRRVAIPTFFVSETTAGYRDPRNPRYSAKLATAIAAWEAVVSPYPNKSVKQSLSDWITGNGSKTGLGGETGIVSPTAAEEVAKVANWQTAGGATPTAISEADESGALDKELVQNFEKPIEGYKFLPGDPEDDLPF